MAEVEWMQTECVTWGDHYATHFWNSCCNKWYGSVNVNTGEPTKDFSSLVCIFQLCTLTASPSLLTTGRCKKCGFLKTTLITQIDCLLGHAWNGKSKRRQKEFFKVHKSCGICIGTKVFIPTLGDKTSLFSLEKTAHIFVKDILSCINCY